MAQLITAYYLAERQTDALDAYQRLRSTLSEDLGIEPGPTLRTLQQRILRQERLDVQQIAQSDASEIATILAPHVDFEYGGAVEPGAAALMSPDAAIRWRRW